MTKQIGDLKLYDVEELASLLDVQEKTIRAYLRAVSYTHLTLPTSDLV